MAAGERSEPTRQGFRDLLVWQQAMALVEAIYAASRHFPRSEDYALASQMRRAAVSVPSNIAEGYGRGTTKDYVGFLMIARASLWELETQVEIARRVGYITEAPEAELRRQIASVGKLLGRLIASVRS